MQSRFLLGMSWMLSSAIYLSSCTSGGGKSGAGGSSSTQPVIDASGKKIYTVDPSTGATISASGISSSDPSFANAALVIPPGALSLPVDISIFQAQPLASSSTAAAVGSSNLTAAGPAVAVLPSQSVSISNPLAISLPYSALTSLTGEKQLVVIAIYPGESKSELETFVGSELDLGTEGVVKVSIIKFGAFQVVYSDTVIEKKKVETNFVVEQKKSGSTPPASNPYSAYNGTWFKGCTQHHGGENPTFIRNSVTVSVNSSGVGTATGLIRIYSDPACFYPVLSESRTENIKFVGSSATEQGAHNVDSELSALSITTYGQSETICGRVIQPETATPLTAATCMGDERYSHRFLPSYDLVKVVGNMLYTGECPDGSDCSAFRPQIVGRTYLTRQVEGKPDFELFGPSLIVVGGCAKFTLKKSSQELLKPLRLAQNVDSDLNGRFYLDENCQTTFESPLTAELAVGQEQIDFYYKKNDELGYVIINIKDADDRVNFGISSHRIEIVDDNPDNGDDDAKNFNLADEINKIKGVWTAGCVDESARNSDGNVDSVQSTRTLFSFDSTSIKLITYTYFESPNCEPKYLHKVVESEGHFQLGAPDVSTNGSVKIDAQIVQDFVTPKSSSAVAELNGQSSGTTAGTAVCGQIFELGLPKLLNAQLCAGHPRANDFLPVYAVIQVNQDGLKLGESKDERTGVSPAKRKVDLPLKGLQKIANIVNSVTQPVTPIFGAWKSPCLLASNYYYTRSVHFVDNQFVRSEHRFSYYDASCQYGPTVEFKEIGTFTFNDMASPKQIDFAPQKKFVRVNSELLLADFNGTATGSTAFCGGGFALGEIKEITLNQCTVGESRAPNVAQFDIYNVNDADKLAMGVASNAANGSGADLRPTALDDVNLLTRLTELEGGYTATCLPGLEATSYYLMTRFTGSSFVAYKSKYSSFGCDSSSYVGSVEFKGTFSVTSSVSGPSNLNTTIQEINMWFGNDEQAFSPIYDAFYSEICSQGVRNGRNQINGSTPAVCGLPANQFNIFNIGGGFLSLGQAIGENTTNCMGSSDASRPANFSSAVNLAFGLVYKTSVSNPPDNSGDNGGYNPEYNPDQPVFTLVGPSNMTQGACAAFSISASSAPTTSTLFTPSMFINSITGQFFADNRCRTQISQVSLVAGSNVSNFYFKPTLQSGVSMGSVTLKVSEQSSGLQLSPLTVTVQTAVSAQ